MTVRDSAWPILALAVAGAGCTSTDHVVAQRGDLLREPAQMETLGESMESAQRDGCLRAGANRDFDCREELREWGEVLAPPELPEAPPTPDND